MKLEEIKMGMEVKVIKVEGLGCSAEEHYIGKIGKVIDIISKEDKCIGVPYPIEVNFGYEEIGLFTPEELEKV